MTSLHLAAVWPKIFCPVSLAYVDPRFTKDFDPLHCTIHADFFLRRVVPGGCGRELAARTCGHSCPHSQTGPSPPTGGVPRAVIVVWDRCHRGVLR